MHDTMKRLTFWACAVLLSVGTQAQITSEITIHTNQGKDIIPREIYGQFSEYLGTCIYGGLWVGRDSKVPNIDGYRSDVFHALKDLNIPVLRWPGGCFADEYHWMDGIGPQEQRSYMVNNNWGGTTEDNSFGTHEFLNLCEMLGCEPYISGNVGSGSVQELAQWVEYMTSDSRSSITDLRKKNGREKPWKVKYLGVGNESWGCGGNMRPEYYSDLYRRYATYCRNFGENKLYKVASGASDTDMEWTRVLMKNARGHMDGLSLHYYTVIDWNQKGSSVDFSHTDYFNALYRCLTIEPILKQHIAIMDEYDPDGEVDLLLDEWGTWWDVMPGTNPGFLFQQNTMRDALVASMSLDIFHKYTRRLKMANIAQIVNVLQAMILTRPEGGMVLTPTYYVFRMYKNHQNATFIPADVKCATAKDEKGHDIPLLSTTTSRDSNGVLHLCVSNASPTDSQVVTVSMDNMQIKHAEGEILTAAHLNDVNDFDKLELVKPVAFKGVKVQKGQLQLTLPPHSIVSLTVQ